jgi:hypothetical protein
LKLVTLTSPLPLAECLRRIKAAIGELSSFFSDKDVIGTFDEGKFELRKRPRGKYKPTTVLLATLVEDWRGTVLRCHFSTNLLITYILAGLGTLFILGIKVDDLHIREQAGSISDIVEVYSSDILGIVVILIVGALVIVINTWSAQTERKFLIDFVCRTLDARELQTIPKQISSAIIRARD